MFFLFEISFVNLHSDKTTNDMKKQNLVAIWGNWDKLCINDYVNHTKLMSVYDITEDLGYDEDDIQQIKNLNVGETWLSEFGNHIIMRISE
jgi:hypothetical protein